MHIIVYILSLNILFSFEFIFETNQIDVTQDSVVLEHPFSGGLNRPKIQWIDWDEDGDDDLFILDEDGYLRYMKNESTGDNFKFIIQKTDMFNIYIGDWFYIADFDGDFDLDLVTQNHINFNQASYYMNENWSFQYSGNLSILSDPIMTPTFSDIDNDGDLDFFTPNYVGTVNFYENSGVLSENVPQYEYITNSWQNISVIGPSVRHGAAAIRFIDLDGDGDLDLSWGDYFQQSMYIIWNNGNSSTPIMNVDNITYQYPPGDPIVTSGQNMPSFSDIDNDGDLDFFASVLSGAFGSGLQWINNFIYYENTGSNISPSYEHQSDNFLNSIDILLNSAPELYDIDQDGDEDLFIGTMVDPSINPWTGRIHFYRNIGSVNYPEFELETKEFLGTDLGTNLSITFGDLNFDGLPDALVGNANGELKIFINNGNESFVFQGNAPGIDLSGVSTPEFWNTGCDEENILLVGEADGDINFYLIDEGNQGQVIFNWMGDNFIESSLSHASPELVDIDGDLDLDLLIGTGYDGIKVYQNFSTSESLDCSNLSFSFEEVEGLDIDYYGSDLHLSTGSLYNGNKSVVVGLSTGGLYILKLYICSKGDLNSDTIVDVLDIISMVNYITSNINLEVDCEADINNDGELDILDVVGLVSIIMSQI